MKKYLLLIAVLFFVITTKVNALTFEDDYVYTTGGTKITLEDYKLIRRFFKYRDEMFDVLDTDLSNHYVGFVHDMVYSNNYLFKISFTSKDSSSWSELTREEGLKMLEENVKEELPYIICLPKIKLEPMTVDYDFDEKDSDIYTHEKTNYYDKYCGLDVILKAYEEDNTENKETTNEATEENRMNMAVISVIPTSIVIILFFAIRKWKKLKEVK